MSKDSFDDLTHLYEAIIDWPKRLANEAPFFRRLFEQADARRVADVACGTGRHAQMFHSWGLRVHASDISASMIQRAREMFGESDNLRWKVQSFEHPIAPERSLDAVVCIGNSLALAADANIVSQALRSMLCALRPGGLCIVHVLNLWSLPDGPCIWQKCVKKSATEENVAILKGVHRCTDRGYVELVEIKDSEGAAPIRARSVGFLGLRSQDLEAVAREHAAEEVAFFGNHHDQPYDAERSADLIMVARKG